MDCARAFAPGNISGVFKIIAHEKPEKMHSLGMGFTVSEGVVVEVRQADESAVFLNRELADFPTVRSVAAAVTDVAVSAAIETALPLSSGFGLSGASALATAYALNSLLDMGRSEEELAMAAHVAEVGNLTGLGDVCGQFHGGKVAVHIGGGERRVLGHEIFDVSHDCGIGRFLFVGLGIYQHVIVAVHVAKLQLARGHGHNLHALRGVETVVGRFAGGEVAHFGLNIGWAFAGLHVAGLHNYAYGTIEFDRVAAPKIICCRHKKCSG